jgi:hypothetical protein
MVMFVVENLHMNFTCKVKITSSNISMGRGMPYIQGHYIVSTVFSLSFPFQKQQCHEI